MDRLLPDLLYVGEVSKGLGVKPSVVYYWIYSSLIEAKKVKLPPSTERELSWAMGIYKLIFPIDRTLCTRLVRWMISPNDIQWLVIIKLEAPEILQTRPRGFLRVEKEQYLEIMKEAKNV